MLSPACPWSSSLRNISTPVHVLVWVSRRPTISICFADLDDATLDAPGHHRAATGDREHVLDGHQERLVEVADRVRNPRVARVHQLEDALGRVRLPRVALQRLERRAADDRRVVAVVVVLAQQLLNLDLDQLEHLLVSGSSMSTLFRNTTIAGMPDLTTEQDVLARLRHRAVGRRHDQDRAVHLRRARDHVLDVVGVAGAVDVRVVALLRVVLDVSRRDRDPALALFRRLVDILEVDLLGPTTTGRAPW